MLRFFHPNLLLIALFSIPIFFVGCESDADFSSPDGSSGTGGSLARFMLAGDFMYLVDNTKIKTLNVANPADPVLVNEQTIAEGIESIFRLGERLFIGSSTGLFLYTIGTDGLPVRQGEFLYENLNFEIYPCDPVVANDSLAFVTLNSTIEVERCNRITAMPVRQLNIFQVTDFQQPTMIAQYEMDNPQGVGLDGNLLFVCENQYGLKVYDVSNPQDIQLLAHLEDFTAHDVIPLNGLLLVVGTDNVYQVDYSDLSNIRVVSKIPIGA